MANGIPVLASTRGALPETLGDAGFLFDVPARYTPESGMVLTTEEVEPWVETIIRLWDDAAFYGQWSDRARAAPSNGVPSVWPRCTGSFFGSLCHQPGPPLVPKGALS